MVDIIVTLLKMSELYVYEEDDPVVQFNKTETNLNKEESNVLSVKKTNHLEEKCLKKIQKLNVSTVDQEIKSQNTLKVDP